MILIQEKLEDFTSENILSVNGITTIKYKTKINNFNLKEVINLYSNKKFLDFVKDNHTNIPNKQNLMNFDHGIRFILFNQQENLTIFLFPQGTLHEIFLKQLNEPSLTTLSKNNWFDLTKKELLFQGVVLNKSGICESNLPNKITATELWNAILELNLQSVFKDVPLKIHGKR